MLGFWLLLTARIVIASKLIKRFGNCFMPEGTLNTSGGETHSLKITKLQHRPITVVWGFRFIFWVSLFYFLSSFQLSHCFKDKSNSLSADQTHHKNYFMFSFIFFKYRRSKESTKCRTLSANYYVHSRVSNVWWMGPLMWHRHFEVMEIAAFSTALDPSVFCFKSPSRQHGRRGKKKGSAAAFAWRHRNTNSIVMFAIELKVHRKKDDYWSCCCEKSCGI